MTVPAAGVPQTGGPRKRRRWVLATFLAAALLAAGVAGLLRLRPEGPPEPPAVGLEECDPAVAVAVQKAREAVSASPRSAAAWGRLGMVLFNGGFTPQSRECFTQAEGLAPREPVWPYYRALTQLSEDPPAALVDLRRTVELCGDDPDAPRLRLAELLLECGQEEEAERQCRLALKANPASARAQLGLARLAYERGQLQASRELLAQAVRSPHTERTARVLLAQVEERLGEHKTAERERQLAEMISRPASWPDPYLDRLAELRVGRQAEIDRSHTLLAEGRAAEAGAAAEGLVGAYPDAGEAWLLLGEARLQLGQAQAAEAALQQAVRLMPDSVEAHFGLGTSLFMQHEHAEAAACFRQVAQLKPTSATAHYNLGLCLLRLGDADGAGQAFATAVHYQPQLADAHRRLGELLARKGQSGKAAEHLRAALEANPGDEEARRLLREVQRQGQSSKGPRKGEEKE